MNKNLAKMLSNLAPIACVIGAILLAMKGIEGWELFLIIALFTTNYNT